MKKKNNLMKMLAIMVIFLITCMPVVSADLNLNFIGKLFSRDTTENIKLESANRFSEETLESWSESEDPKLVKLGETLELLYDEDTEILNLDIETNSYDSFEDPREKSLQEPTVPQFPGVKGAGVGQDIAGSLSIASGEFAPNLFTGGANYAYPIKLIPGVNNLIPDVSLGYSHLSTNAIQYELGTAWALNTPIITRDINYTRNNTNDDSFRINFNGLNSKLILGDDTKYHTEIESYFSIEKLTGGTNQFNEYWLVKTKEGNKFYFGYTQDSELVSNQENYVVKWSISKIEDVHGNQLTYSYVENPLNELGTSYLDLIIYNNGLNKIKFNYEQDSDFEIQIYMNGLKIKKSIFLDEIDIKYDDQIIYHYDLNYTEIQNKKLLSSITYVSNGESLPPTIFNYYESDFSWEESENYKIPSEYYFGEDEDKGVRLLDFNGDGLLDLLKMEDTDDLHYKLNLGDSFGEEQIISNFLSGGFVDEYHRDQGIRFVDFNGDIRADLIQYYLDNNDTILTYKKNEGDGFENSSINIPDDFELVQILTPPPICEPELCDEDYDDLGFVCDSDYYCNRTCVYTYEYCGENWVLVDENEGDGFYEEESAEEYDDTTGFTPINFDKCYKFEVETANNLRLRVIDNECFNILNETFLGDTFMVAGMKGSEIGSSWLSGVSPISSKRGWYGDLEIDDLEIQNTYLTSYEYADDDFSNDNEDDFAEDDREIYCMPSYESCYFSNITDGCGFGCQDESMESYLASGYYIDVTEINPELNWFDTYLYNLQCDDETVNQNKAHTIRMNVYESDVLENESIYNTYCQRPRNYKDLGVRLVDVNGDGKTDIVKANSSQRITLINKGDYFEESENWKIPFFLSFVNQNNSNTGLRFIDINGDGLLDLFNSNLSNSSLPNLGINNGRGWELSTSWTIPEEGYIFVEGQNKSNSVQYLDLDSDGLMDILTQDENGTYKIYINQFYNFELNGDLDLPSGLNLSNYGSSIVDINGDNLLDFVLAETSNLDKRKTWLNTANSFYLLKSIETTQGSSVELNYDKISEFDNTGDDDIPDLAFNGWVLTSITKNNGMIGPHELNLTTYYSYENGLFDYESKEFRGFGFVEEIKQDETIIRHWFHQEDYKKGIEYATLILDKNLNPYTQINNNFLVDESEDIVKLMLTNVSKKTYDTLNLNDNISYDNFTQLYVFYDYDDFGNQIKISDLGDIEIGGDEKYTYNEFVYNENDWIVNKPKSTYIKDSDDTEILSQTNFMYDNQPYGLAPIKGDVTQVDKFDFVNNKTITNKLSYNSIGNIIETIDGRNYSTYYDYEDTNNFIDVSTNSLNQNISFTYDLITGNLLSKTDPNGISIYYEYDDLGRLTKEILPYSTSQKPSKLIEYDLDNSPPHKVIMSYLVNYEESERIYNYEYYDGFFKIIQTKNQAENNNLIINNVFYNQIEKNKEVKNPYFDSENFEYTTPDESVAGTTYEYDALGRFTSLVYPDNTTISKVYDFYRDIIYNQDNNKQEYFKDSHNNIIQIKEYNKNEVFTTNYIYDEQNNLVEIIDNQDNSILYEYGSLNEKISMEDPNMGLWTYEYDNNGNILEQTDNKGNIITFEYDELNRLTSSSSSNNTISYVYDTEMIGQLTQITTPFITKSYTYDNKARILTETITIDSQTLNKSYEYDDLDRIIAIQMPNGQEVNYEYNEQGLLESISNEITDINYNEFGKPIAKYYGNNLITEFEYYPLNFKLKNINTENLQDLSYEYDIVGNIIQINDSVGDEEIIYDYDKLGRLISAFKNNTYNMGYKYDSIGNMLRIIDTGTIYDYEYNSLPHTQDQIIKRNIIYTLEDGSYLKILIFNSTLNTSTAFRINTSYAIYNSSFEIEGGEGYRKDAGNESGGSE